MRPEKGPSLVRASDAAAVPHVRVAAYLTPAEVAAELQISDKTVYRWAAQDATMPVLRIGGVVRFPRERFMAWLRDREHGLGRRRSTKQSLSVLQPAAIAGVTDAANAPCAVPCAETVGIAGAHGGNGVKDAAGEPAQAERAGLGAAS